MRRWMPAPSQLSLPPTQAKTTLKLWATFTVCRKRLLKTHAQPFVLEKIVMMAP